MKKLLTALFLSLTLFSGMAYAENKASPLTEKQAIERLQEGKEVYSCPMHTDIFSESKEKCPICGMELKKVKDVKDGKAVFGESNSTSMDMKGMDMKDMKDMPMKDMKMMEKK